MTTQFIDATSCRTWVGDEPNDLAYLFFIGMNGALPTRALSPLDVDHYDQIDNDWVPFEVRDKTNFGYRLTEVRDYVGRLRFPFWEYTAAGNNYSMED